MTVEIDEYDVEIEDDHDGDDENLDMMPEVSQMDESELQLPQI